MSAVLAPPPLMTAEEFMERYGGASGIELVKGRVVVAGGRLEVLSREEGMPNFRHGVICRKAARLLEDFVLPRGLGWIAANDTFVKVGEETVRGADVLFVSYFRVPRGDGMPPESLDVPPELVIEVRSPSDRISAISSKAAEYLASGVGVVVVLDPASKSATVFQDDEYPITLRTNEKLAIPNVLPGFEVEVAKFFE